MNTASDSVNEIATVRIELRHTDPLIWRQVEVSTSITLNVLHDIIEAVITTRGDTLRLFGDRLSFRLGPPQPPGAPCVLT